MSLTGRTVVFTGRISRPRHVFKKLVEDNGGIASDSVTKFTDYLVVGEDPGSKLVKATLLGVKILTEGDFLSLIEDADIIVEFTQEERENPSLITEEKWLKIKEVGIKLLDGKDFETELQKQKDRSRAAGQLDTGDWVPVHESGKIIFSGYEGLNSKTVISRWRKAKIKGKEIYQIVLYLRKLYLPYMF